MNDILCRGDSYYMRYLQEMELLDESAIIYKMVGPVLVKQDPAEAKQTVTKRLDYINKEMYVVLCRYKHCLQYTTIDHVCAKAWSPCHLEFPFLARN